MSRILKMGLAGSSLCIQRSPVKPDAVIVGSAVVQLLPERDLEGMKTLISALRQSLDKEDHADASDPKQSRI